MCRGTWARVTIDDFRHLALQNLLPWRAPPGGGGGGAVLRDGSRLCPWWGSGHHRRPDGPHGPMVPWSSPSPW
jgi:hypothetical protein